MNDREAMRRYIEDRSIPIPGVGCWLWLRSFGSHGYGNACWHKLVTVAHRISFVAFVAPIPDGALVEHSCDNHWCVAPCHLRLGTDATNAWDKQVKGRASKKLSFEQVLAIRNLIDEGASLKMIGQAVGVDGALIARIRDGRVWKHAA